MDLKKRGVILGFWSGIFFLFLFAAILLLAFNFAPKFLENSLGECNDGTSFGECAKIKPYYCSEGVLTEKASACGCPEGFTRKIDSCISAYQSNPKNITLDYTLYGEKKSIDFVVYQDLEEYISKIPRSIDYVSGQNVSRTDFKIKAVNEKTQKGFLLSLVLKIQNTTSDKDEQAKIAVSMVQSIPYGFSDGTLKLTGSSSVAYSRYPYEVLYELEGICGEKSELLAFLLKELSFDVVIFYNLQENHESVGIKCPLSESWQDSGYCFVETSGNAIISDSTLSYSNGVKIKSKPEIMKISDGISLSSGLEDYKDAKAMMKLREKIEENGKLSIVDEKTYNELKKKYGISEESYGLD